MLGSLALLFGDFASKALSVDGEHHLVQVFLDAGAAEGLLTDRGVIIQPQDPLALLKCLSLLIHEIEPFLLLRVEQADLVECLDVSGSQEPLVFLLALLEQVGLLPRRHILLLQVHPKEARKVVTPAFKLLSTHLFEGSFALLLDQVQVELTD